MDMLVHVSIFDLQRNLRRYLSDGRILNSFMPGWRDAVDAKAEAIRQSAPLSLLAIGSA